MSDLADIVPPEVAKELFRFGYAVVLRPRDPFEPIPGTIPKDRVYQWMHMVHDKIHWHREGNDSTGWAPVEHDRHPGVFGPIGSTGHIIKGALGLFEKPKFEVAAEQQNYIDRARRQGYDVIRRFNAGLPAGMEPIGGASVIEESGEGERGHIPADPFKPNMRANLSAIPTDMRPHLARLMAVRDEMYVAMIGNEPVDDSVMALYKDRALAAAIEKVRAEIRNPKPKETPNGPPSTG